MKHWILIFALFACAACGNDATDQPQKTAFINLAENKIATDFAGVKRRIAVVSNCDWSIRSAPQWCVMEQVTEGENTYLDVEILPNEDEAAREAVVVLWYGEGPTELVTTPLYLSQSGKKPGERMPWQVFPVTGLINTQYDLLEDQVTRRYRIWGTSAFITPGFGHQIYPGNLIDRRTDNRTLTDYSAKYTFNPIHLFAISGRTIYEQDVTPSFEAMDALAQQVIATLPQQSQRFIASPPIPYNSYRHLHLLGRGNLGLNLDEIISGKPYTEQEMTRRTGIIFAYVHELFRVSMENPEKLINETVTEQEGLNMSYIDNVNYGKTALLLIESDEAFEVAKRVLIQITHNENLTNEQMKIAQAFEVSYLRFDQFGTHPAKGGYTLIQQCIQEIQNLSTGIIPLNFTTRRYPVNREGEIEVRFELP